MNARHLAAWCSLVTCSLPACGAEDLGRAPASVAALHPVQEVGRPLSSAELRTLASRLRSGDATQVAWGAFAAGEARAHEAVPDLLQALRVAIVEGADDAFLWDALLRLEAQVPPDLVRWAVREGGAQGLVSAVLHPAVHEATLLEVIEADAARNWRWKAAANRLAAIRSRAFTATLLDGVAIDVQVVRCGFGIGGGYGYSGCGFHFAAAGLPPRAVYRLVGAGEDDDGCWLTVPGPEPVCVTRTTYGGVAGPPPAPEHVREPSEVSLPPPSEWPPLDLHGYERDDDVNVRLEYLAALVGWAADELGLAAHVDVEVPCDPELPDDAYVGAEIVRLERAFTELQEALRAAGVLAADTSFQLAVNVLR